MSTMIGNATAPPMESSASQGDELLRRLARVTARTCTDSTVVLARDGRPFLEALRSRKLDASAAPLAADPTAVWKAGCAVVAIEDACDVDLLPGIVQHVWSRLAERGRLLVIVPNADVEGHKRGGLRERDVRHLLQDLGRPVTVSDQPFTWVLMHVDRAGPRKHDKSRSTLERYEAMAGLCRGSVLELGCGAGALAAAIHERGHTVAGIDHNGPKIERARSAFPDIEFIEADICQADLLTGRLFDTVVLAEVLEHVTDGVGEMMLATARRLLASGGRIVISVPNRNCIPHRNHIRSFDAARLKEIVSRFGPPRAAATQPYKWLLMYADLPG
jgi:2-polyprenyl-3-methyl-5-hydroxy-6-metoxy-1,4-benzoquinol methylase